jgi:regulator of replication initiation timing
MVLKMFNKVATADSESIQDNESNKQDRIDRLESHIGELGGEVIRLRQEVNTLLARQHTFKMALRRLREYLEERGNQEEDAAEEVSASFQDISHESEEEVKSDSSDQMNRTKTQTKLH